MCIVCIDNNINRNVYMYLNTHIFPTTGYARVLLFMFIRRELGGKGTGCLFQFTYCATSIVVIIIFAYSLDPDQARQNAKLFDSLRVFLKEFFERVILKKVCTGVI